MLADETMVRLFTRVCWLLLLVSRVHLTQRGRFPCRYIVIWKASTRHMWKVIAGMPMNEGAVPGAGVNQLLGHVHRCRAPCRVSRGSRYACRTSAGTLPSTSRLGIAGKRFPGSPGRTWWSRTLIAWPRWWVHIESNDVNHPQRKMPGTARGLAVLAPAAWVEIEASLVAHFARQMLWLSRCPAGSARPFHSGKAPC